MIIINSCLTQKRWQRCDGNIKCVAFWKSYKNTCIDLLCTILCAGEFGLGTVLLTLHFTLTLCHFYGSPMALDNKVNIQRWH